MEEAGFDLCWNFGHMGKITIVNSLKRTGTMILVGMMFCFVFVGFDVR